MPWYLVVSIIEKKYIKNITIRFKRKISEVDELQFSRVAMENIPEEKTWAKSWWRWRERATGIGRGKAFQDSEAAKQRPKVKCSHWTGQLRGEEWQMRSTVIGDQIMEDCFIMAEQGRMLSQSWDEFKQRKDIIWHTIHTHTRSLWLLCWK